MVRYAGNLISFHDRREDGPNVFANRDDCRCTGSAVRYQTHHRSVRCHIGLMFPEIDVELRSAKAEESTLRQIVRFVAHESSRRPSRGSPAPQIRKSTKYQLPESKRG